MTKSSETSSFERLYQWLGGSGCIAVVGLGLSLIGVSLVGPSDDEARQAVRDRGPLTVITLNSPTTYFEARDGEYAGFEFALTQAFADWLGVEVRYEVQGSIAEVLEALAKNPGAVAAAGLTPTRNRARRFRFGPAYQEIEQQVVCHRRVRLPRELEDLTKLELMVTGGSSYVDTLQEIQTVFPKLKWTEAKNLATEQILAKVWRRKVDCAVADSNIVSINRRYFPELEVSLSLGEASTLAWAMDPGDGPLLRTVRRWFKEMKTSGRLAGLRHRYYGYLGEYDYYDTRVFRRRVVSRLPKYEGMIRKAARKYGFSWTLLAAMAYQESHWDPGAESATGVRGIMMLTRNTASSLGVTNRLDPQQSIMGGARYLKRMQNRLPKSVTGKNRVWQALAAYNVGMGHLQDARKLARSLGRDPDRWVELREVLPLLTRREYFSKLKHGYARGLEPVQYVQRIRNYRDLIEQLRLKNRRPTAQK